MSLLDLNLCRLLRLTHFPLSTIPSFHRMSLYEQRYREWCDQMAAKATLEKSSVDANVPGAQVEQSEPVIHAVEVSDSESIHSRHEIQVETPTRRRAMSDPKPQIFEHVIPQARIGTWPRSAQPSVSHTTPSIPRRRSSYLSSTSRRRPDLVAFHRESCRLFSSMDATIVDSEHSSIHRPISSRLASTVSIPGLQIFPDAVPKDSTAPIRPALSIVTSWKSEETRRIEYHKIDRAHTGLRGLSKKLLPKFCQKRCWRNFFCGKCDGDSVRRYRMPFSDGEADSDRDG